MSKLRSSAMASPLHPLFSMRRRAGASNSMYIIGIMERTRTGADRQLAIRTPITVVTTLPRNSVHTSLPGFDLRYMLKTRLRSNTLVTADLVLKRTMGPRGTIPARDES